MTHSSTPGRSGHSSVVTLLRMRAPRTPVPIAHTVHRPPNTPDASTAHVPMRFRSLPPTGTGRKTGMLSVCLPQTSLQHSTHDITPTCNTEPTLAQVLFWCAPQHNTIDHHHYGMRSGPTLGKTQGRLACNPGLDSACVVRPRKPQHASRHNKGRPSARHGAMFQTRGKTPSCIGCRWVLHNEHQPCVVRCVCRRTHAPRCV